jgi:hypothetical protein
MRTLRRRNRVGGALLTAVLAAACSEEGGAGDGSSGTGGGTGAGGPPAGEVTCAADCTADLTAARAALEAGDAAGAFAQYRCADSRAAAFGAGLTRLLTMLEGPAVTQMMTHLGLSPLVAGDFLGPESIVSRRNRRWDGEGALAVTGAVTAALSFDHAQLRSGDWPTLDAEDWTTDATATLNLELDEPTALTTGTVLALGFDCTAAVPSRLMDPAFG